MVIVMMMMSILTWPLCFLLLSIHIFLTFHVPSPAPSFTISHYTPYCIDLSSHIGGSSKEYKEIKSLGYQSPKVLHALLDRLADNIGDYAIYQVCGMLLHCFLWYSLSMPCDDEEEDEDDEYTNLCNLCFLLLSIHLFLTFHHPSPSASFTISHCISDWSGSPSYPGFR